METSPYDKCILRWINKTLIVTQEHFKTDTNLLLPGAFPYEKNVKTGQRKI